MKIKILKDNRGATMVIFALLIIPIFLVVGAAVDYSSYNTAQAKMQAIADAAALAAAKALQDEEKPEPVIKGIIEAEYTNDMATSDIYKMEYRYDDVNGKIRVDINGLKPMTLMSMVGYESMEVRVFSETVWKNSEQIAILFLVDASVSMTAPAEDVPMPVRHDIVIGDNGERGNCYFACHDDSGNMEKEGITSKIRYVSEMVRDLLGDLNKISKGNISVSVDTFAEEVIPVVALTSNIPGAMNTVGAGLPVESAERYMEPGYSPNFGNVHRYNESNLPKTFAELATKGAAIPGKKAFVIITDGAHRTEQNMQGAFGRGFCSALRQQGTVYTINIRHGERIYDNPEIPMTKHAHDLLFKGGEDRDDNGNLLVWRLGINNVPATLTSCAGSPSRYFEGEHAGDIRDAFVRLSNSLTTSFLRVIN